MAEAAKKQMAVCMPQHLGEAEHKRHDWVVDVPIKVTLEECMEPGYWAHVAEQMEPLDHIHLRAEDGSWVAYLIVSFCERNYARTVLDRVIKLDMTQTAPVDSIKHKVEWKGNIHKFTVIRVADGASVQSGFAKQELAADWLREHEKSLAR